MKFLGIDYGDRHVGLAIGDSETKLAVPVTTVERAHDAQLIESLRTFAAQEGIDHFVVGIPEGPKGLQEQRKKNLSFAAHLQEEFPSCRVYTTDESFSSLDAKKRLQEAGMPRADDHSIAAMLLLQGFLDRL